VDSAADRVASASRERVAELEVRVRALEADIVFLKEQNAKRADAILELNSIGSSEHKWVSDNLDILFENDETLRSTLNQTRAAQGWAPLTRKD